MAREGQVEDAERRLRRWGERLRLLEGELEVRERRADVASKLATGPHNASPKVGRNERCPCGSGLKYKHCHGLASR